MNKFRSEWLFIASRGEAHIAKSPDGALMGAYPEKPWATQGRWTYKLVLVCPGYVQTTFFKQDLLRPADIVLQVGDSKTKQQ